LGFGLAAEALHGGVVEPVSCLDFGLGGAVEVKQVLCLAWVLAEHRDLVSAGFSAVAEAIDLTVNEHHDGAEGEEDEEWMNGDHGWAGLGVAGAIAAEDGEASKAEEREQKDDGSEPGMLPGLLGESGDALVESNDVQDASD
jgi:hypothetical protein